MAARSLWNGAVTFGGVMPPVKLFSAVQKDSVEFHEVRLSDRCHRRVVVAVHREVPSDSPARVKQTT